MQRNDHRFEIHRMASMQNQVKADIDDKKKLKITFPSDKYCCLEGKVGSRARLANRASIGGEWIVHENLYHFPLQSLVILAAAYPYTEIRACARESGDVPSLPTYVGRCTIHRMLRTFSSSAPLIVTPLFLRKTTLCSRGLFNREVSIAACWSFRRARR